MTRKYLATPILAAAFALSLLAHPAFSQTTSTAPKAATAAKPSAEAQEVMKFSQDGNSAIRDIAGARVAIFDGNTKLASELIGKAKVSVEKAQLEAPSFTMNTTESVGGKNLGTTSETEKAQMVPVDGQMVLSDDFVATPEKQARINKANEHFKNGKKKEALEELRLGEIEVNYSRVWMPLASASKHIEQATKLMDDHKYYEANLALKAVSDSLIVDSVSLTELPKKHS